MKGISRSSTFWLIAATLPLLFLPKINLLSFDGESAGLRIDDLILLFLSIIIFWIRFSVSFRLTVLEKDVCLIVGLGILSFVFNKYLFTENILKISASLPYAVRILEYFLFYYIGLWSVRYVNVYRLLWAFLGVNFMIICLQKGGILGAFFLGHYNPHMSGRVTGIASFPTEMGVLLNLIFAYLVFSRDNINVPLFWPPLIRVCIGKMWIVLLFLFFSVLTILTGTRAALFTLPVLFFIRLSKNSMKWLCILPLLVLLLLPLIKNTDELFQRSQSLFSWQNLSIIKEVWKKVDVDIEKEVGPVYVVQATEGQDVSWLMRINKWIFVTKNFVSHPEAWLLGLGPGFSGSGLDGGLLRILVDGGICSCMAYFLFFKHLAAISLATRWLVFTLILNMVFVDAHIAYKIASFFFFLIGVEHAKMGAIQESHEGARACISPVASQRFLPLSPVQQFSLDASPPPDHIDNARC